MPVLAQVNKRFAKDKPFKGLKMAACLHVTASLWKHDRISTYAIRGEDSATYHKHLFGVIERGPDLTMDDGADLVSALHTSHTRYGTGQSTLDGIATLKLKAMGIPIDHLTAEQKKYLSSWDMGTNRRGRCFSQRAVFSSGYLSRRALRSRKAGSLMRKRASTSARNQASSCSRDRPWS